jgi:hypothetical protein
MGAETSKLQEATEEVQQELEQQAVVQEVGRWKSHTCRHHQAHWVCVLVLHANHCSQHLRPPAPADSSPWQEASRM